MDIVIVGGGFTGTLLAAQLTTHAGDAAAQHTVTLVECAAEIGCGIAYSTPYACHVLNVPAHNMSAWPQHPHDLLQWLRAREGAHYPSADVEADFELRHTFVPRKTFGTYIGTILQAAVTRGLRVVRGTATGIDVHDQHAQIHLEDGQHLRADKVALCLGHFAPAMPKVPGSNTLSPPQLIANPWQWRALESIDAADPDAHVAILGTGLTMVDMFLGLRMRGFAGKVTAISRHGLAPQAHVLGLAQKPTGLPSVRGPRALLRALRHNARVCVREGGDWRQSVDGLRNATPSLWQGMDVRQQQQVLRHLKSYWDIHRHRIAPDVATALHDAQVAGRLRIVAGRLAAVSTAAGALELVVRHRHDGHSERMTAAHLVNCTGGHNNWARSAAPLVQALLAQHLAVPNCHGLGVQADSNGQLLDARGVPSSILHTAGPSLLGRDFESIAVPELRQQAAQLAAVLLRPSSGQKD
jgi:uncharacterized NAD(P)/FAD-binding protein YdhS